MNLSLLLNGVEVKKIFQTMYGKMVTTHDVEVSKINYDSRKIGRSDMFVAISGTGIDGHNFIQQAISNGAKVIVVENDKSIDDSFCMHTSVVKIVVNDSRIALAKISANYFGNPSKKMKMIGVTGTNGKTTVTYLLKQMLEASNEQNVKVGLIGTVSYFVGNQSFSASHTTPESLELHQLFYQMVENNCTHCVMEVSSHSLSQNRVYGIDFSVAVFTNLTQDHLDFHTSMEEYFKAKKILFDNLSEQSFSILNFDSSYGKKIAENSKSQKISFGILSSANLKAENINLSIDGSTCEFKTSSTSIKINTNLVGSFNISNLLAAYGVIVAMKINFKKNIEVVFANLQPAIGRFQKIDSPFGWKAIIDYAHTPDALENCLIAIRQTIKNSDLIITIFGAGGDRDKTKRPLMGEIADKLSDKIVVTSDNPRTENAEKIIDDILIGISRTENVFVDVDRHDAIFRGLSLAETGDVILIAGKGHEDYQVIGKEKIHFNDIEVVEEFIEANK